MSDESKTYPAKIRTKIILASLIPLFLVVLILGAVTYRIAVFNLDAEFGKRLAAIANLTAAQLNPLMLLTLAPDDEDTRIYQHLISQLNQIKTLEEISVITVFDRQNRVLIDTERTRHGTRYGRFYLDQKEIQAAAAGRASASVTFTGADGMIYKSGYAPVYEEKKVVALVGVQGSPAFYASLKLLQRAIILTALLGFALVIVLSVVIAGRLVRPIHRLVQSAGRIGRGEVDEEVPSSSKDELGLLAHSINEMRHHLIERDLRMQMMLRGIAHEIKNPLGGMKLFVDLLRSEVEKSDKLSGYVDKIDTEINTLSRIVNEFMDFSKEATVDKRPGNLRDCIDEVIEFITPSYQKDRVHLTRRLPLEINMNFDWDKMKRVFYNLLENSFQAIKDRGNIVIFARPDKEYWIVSISDDGPGIEATHMENIFKPFFSTKEQGSGLGLAFVKKIIEGHGGALQITSEVGKGTTVELRLPRE